MWEKPIEGWGLSKQGAFSDYKLWSESGLLKKKKHVLLQKEVNKAEKIVCLEVEWKV